MFDDLLADQVRYYRSRATEYDRTSYGDLDTAAQRIEAALDRLRPAGSILELACGTGMWTHALAARTPELTALDSSPEVIEIARERCPGHVLFEVENLFDWHPDRRVDVVFFAFWLSHVPAARIDSFFATVARALSPGGRVLFVDEHIGSAEHEHETWADDEIAERELTDGTRHRLVKVYLDPDALGERLRRLGWTVDFSRDRDWLIGSATRTR